MEYEPAPGGAQSRHSHTGITTKPRVNTGPGAGGAGWAIGRQHSAETWSVDLDREWSLTHTAYFFFVSTNTALFTAPLKQQRHDGDGGGALASAHALHPLSGGGDARGGCHRGQAGAKRSRSTSTLPLVAHRVRSALKKKHHRHRQDSLTDMPPAAYGARPTPLYLDTGVADAGVLEKLETQLRLAKDKLATKSEKVAELEEYKGNLEREMDEFTVTLFEEAHEMVRVEKEARHKDHMLLLQETQDKSSVLQEELKALKALVEHMQKTSGKGGGPRHT